MALCCSSAKHAGDWFCRNIRTRPSCKQEVFAMFSADLAAKSDVEPRGESVSLPQATPELMGGADELQPGSPELQARLQALDSREREPSFAELVELADQLNREGFYEEALAVGRYLEGPFRVSDFYGLAEAYRIQGQAYQARNDKDDGQAAVNAVKLSEILREAATLRSQL